MTSLERCPRLGRLLFHRDKQFGFKKDFNMKLHDPHPRACERRGKYWRGITGEIGEGDIGDHNHGNK